MALSVQLQPERRSWYRQLHRRTRTSCTSEDGGLEEDVLDTSSPIIHETIQKRSHRFASEENADGGVLTFDTQHRSSSSSQNSPRISGFSGHSLDTFSEESSNDSGNEEGPRNHIDYQRVQNESLKSNEFQLYTHQQNGCYEHQSDSSSQHEEAEHIQSPEIIRETRDKEEIHFKEMSSVRNLFEQKGGVAPLPVTPTTEKKSPSKWQPATPSAQEPVVTSQIIEHTESHLQNNGGCSDNEENELPPAGMSRSLVEKFSQFGNQTQSSVPAADYSRASAPPSTVQYSESSRVNTERVRQSQTPDSGIAEVNAEDHLPEQGTTQNLLAQWRNKEQGGDIPKPKPITPTHRAHSTDRELSTPIERQSAERQQSEPPYHTRTYSQEDSIDDLDDGPEVIRPTISSERKEEELPQPSTTKNLLAKFQNLQAEAQRDIITPPKKTNENSTDKQFKWQVKGAQTLRGRTSHEPTPEPVHTPDISYQQHSDNFVHTNGDDHLDSSLDEAATYNHHNDDHVGSHHEDSNHIEDKDDELPPQDLTKSLLAKFRSLEDVTQPPPSPQHATQQKKVLSAYNPNVRVAHTSAQREQPDGGDEGAVYSEQPSENHYDHHQQSDLEDTPMEEESYDDLTIDELPEQGTTRGLLAKFQAMQS